MTWRKEAECLNEDTNLYYEATEEDTDGYDKDLARELDANCLICSVQTRCFAEGVSNKESGIWGGVYFEEGDVSSRFNVHKSKDDWATVWSAITMGGNE